MNPTSPFDHRTPHTLQLSPSWALSDFYDPTPLRCLHWFPPFPYTWFESTSSKPSGPKKCDQNHWQCFNLWLSNLRCERRGRGHSCELFVAMNIQIEVSNSPPYHWCCLSNIFVGPPYIILGSEGWSPAWPVTNNKWLGQSFLAKYLTGAPIFLSLSMYFLNQQNAWNTENAEIQVFLLGFPTREGLIIFREYEAFFPIAFLSASYLLYISTTLQIYYWFPYTKRVGLAA